MRSLSLVWFAIVAVAVAVVGALPTANHRIPINPKNIKTKPIPRSPRQMETKMTNAKRFSMNLPPLKPKLNRGSRVASARQSNTSPRPRTTQTCNILVKNVEGGSTRGYVSPVLNEFGEYGTVQPAQAGALVVSFSYAQDDTSPSQLNFMTLNGSSSAYPLFGGTKGFEFDELNVGPGSPANVFLTGTTQIPAGSTGETGDNNTLTAATEFSRPAESAIWIYNPVTQEITVQWINADGSTAPNYLVYPNGLTAGTPVFVITGDFAVFQAEFQGDFSLVTFTCIPSENPAV